MTDRRPSDHDPGLLAEELDRQLEDSAVDSSDALEKAMEKIPKKTGTAKVSGEKIPGGLAKGKKPSDFDTADLAKGKKVELEHTDNAGVAEEIAMDHLTEDPAYYDKLEKMEKRVSARFVRQAAEVGTDSASVWAIAPENLAPLLGDGDWFDAFRRAYHDHSGLEGDFAKLDIGIREHGGAVFHTGGDGIFDMTIPTREGEMPIVREMGFLPPYGTPASKTVSAEGIPSQHGPWSVDPAKLRAKAPKIADDIARVIRDAGISLDVLKKTTNFRDLAPDHIREKRLEDPVWVRGRNLFPDDDAEIQFKRFMEVCNAVNDILLKRNVIGPLSER